MNYFNFFHLVRARRKGYKEKDYTNYYAFQGYQAQEVLKELQKRGICLTSMKVLELAAGIGGYSRIIKKNCKELIINDTKQPHISKIDHSFRYACFDVTLKYPFPNATFDFVFCSSLIEHIAEPKKMLAEIRRILKPNGILFLSFPPFYSPVGGHIFKPFHYLGETLAVKIINLLYGTNIHHYSTSYGNYGLHIRTITSVRTLLQQHNFTILDYWTRFSPLNVAKIPVLNEILTWHVSFLCKKE